MNRNFLPLCAENGDGSGFKKEKRESENQNRPRFFWIAFAAIVLVSLSAGQVKADFEFAAGRLLKKGELRGSIFPKTEETEFLILSGKFEGSKVTTKNYLWDDSAYNTFLKEGAVATLKINYDRDTGEIESVRIKGYSRGKTVILFFAAFSLLLFAVIGLRAVPVLAALGLNICLFVFALIPFLKSGFNPAAAVFLFSLFSAGMTLSLITGFSKKTAAAAAGITGSIVLAWGLTFVFMKAAHISGFYSEGARRIMAMARAGNIASIDFFLLTVSATMLAALGMAVDVSVGVASFVKELHSERMDMRAAELCRKGVSVGGDMLATMINSLIFVFAGASLPLVLNAHICGIPLLRFINYEAVSGVIFQSLLASFVLIFTIPATSLAAAYLFAGDTARKKRISGESV
ncbi:MAG: YibE/F family protein [Elusimicrobiota bacterium]|nr:YibE/F family protein [Elusimicrobiota bacterium]